MFDSLPLAQRTPSTSTVVPVAGWLLRLPYPVRNVLRRWRGLLGMMIGVGIALGIGMTLLAVTRAEMDLLVGDFRKTGADLFVVTEGGTLVPLLPGDSPGTIKNARSTLARIRAWPEVHAALGFMSWSMVRDQEGPRRANQPTELVGAMGVDGDPAAIANTLALDEGRWLRRADETVLGPKLAREKHFRIGDVLRLNGREFSVVGIGKLRGLGYGFSADAVAYLDYRSFRERADLGDVVSIIAIDTAEPAAVQQRLLEQGNLAPSTPADVVKAAEQVQASGIAVYWVMIGLTLAIAGLFVSNMLNHSVSERRLEFATLRAIGIPTRTILFTVAGEAVLVSLVASVFGIVISLFFGFILDNTLAPAYGFESLYAADAGLFLLVFLLALGLGLVAGLAPARQATRVDPVEVLREA